MFDRLFRMFAPTRAADPFFGQLTLMKIRGKPSYWECERRFAPVDRSVSLFIDTSVDGALPTEAQRDFFRWTETHYDEICAVLEGAFREDAWASRLMKGGFQEEFSLSSFSISLQPKPEDEWEMSFDSKSDPHLFSPTLKGWKVQRICIDG